MGRYCSYLLPKQAGGTTQIIVDKTSRMTGRLRVYSCDLPKLVVEFYDIVVVSRDREAPSTTGDVGSSSQVRAVIRDPGAEME